MDHPVAANNTDSSRNISDVSTTSQHDLNYGCGSGNFTTSQRRRKKKKNVWFDLCYTSWARIVDTASRIKTELFVDKTMLIKKLFINPDIKIDMKKVLIVAPSQFGKTINMDMVKTFLNIQVDKNGKEIVNVEYNKGTRKWNEKPEMELTNRYKLFKKHNLLIYQCQHEPKHTDEEISDSICEHRLFFYKHCGTHPVIHVDFWNIFNDTKVNLRYALENSFREHRYLRKSARLSKNDKKNVNLFCRFSGQLTEEQIIDGLKMLSKYLYKHFNKRAYILIDELHAPIMALLGTNIDDIREASLLIGRVVSAVLKNNDKFVEGALLNSSYSLTEVLSPFGINILNCPFMQNHEFAVYYGLKQAEVEVLLNKPEFAGINRKNVYDCYNRYNIYRQNVKMCNTFSLIYYLDGWYRRSEYDRKKDVHFRTDLFWHYPLEVRVLLELVLKHYRIRNKFYELLVTGQVSIIVLSDNVSLEDVHNLISLRDNFAISDYHLDLYFQFLAEYGYLNIVKKEEEEWTLHIPDIGIAIDLNCRLYETRACILPPIFNKMKIELSTAIEALKQGNRETFQLFANSISNLYSDRDVPEPLSQVELQRLIFTCVHDMWSPLHQINFYGNDVGRPPHHTKFYCEQCGTSRLNHIIIRDDGTGIILKVNHDSARAGLKQIFTSEYYKVLSHFNITKDKIYIGLHYENGKVTISALATDKDSIIKLNNINEIELIEVTSD